MRTRSWGAKPAVALSATRLSTTGTISPEGSTPTIGASAYSIRAPPNHSIASKAPGRITVSGSRRSASRAAASKPCPSTPAAWAGPATTAAAQTTAAVRRRRASTTPRAPSQARLPDGGLEAQLQAPPR